MEEFATVVTCKDKRQRARKLVIELKTNKPCLDCKETFPHYMMDFDHRPGVIKLGNIETIARTGDIQAVLNEVTKCDLICSNCHRHRTYMRSAGVARSKK